MNEPIVLAEVCDPNGEQRATDAPTCPVVLAQVVRSEPPATGSSVFDNGWAMVGLLFVAGPLGLPALWFSRHFSRKVKLTGTIGALLLTVVLPAALIWYLYATVIGPAIDALTG